MHPKMSNSTKGEGMIEPRERSCRVDAELKMKSSDQAIGTFDFQCKAALRALRSSTLPAQAKACVGWPLKSEPAVVVPPPLKISWLAKRETMASQTQ
jgi:hypothetical protein